MTTPSPRSSALRSTTLTTEGRAVRRRLLAALAAFLAVVALGLVARIFDRSTAVDGPAGSSYVTTAMGTAALYETLDALGGEPVRLRRPVADDQLAGADTYLVLDPGFTTYGDVEVAAIRRFARGGGTVVVAGVPPASLVDGLLEDPPDWSAAVVVEASTTDPPLVEGVGRVVAGRFGAFDRPGSARPALVSGERALALVEDLGQGRVVLVADLAVFSNQSLDEADNAEFAVGVIGTGRAVFDEYRQGYTEGEPGGLIASLPGRWNETVALLAVVALIGLVVYGRRLGPPEPVERRLAPERRAFLESVARSLRRTKDPLGATEPVRRAALDRVARLGRLPADAPPETLAEAARKAGLADEEVEALLRPSAPDSVLAADRALARLSAGPGGPAPPPRDEEDG